MIEAEFVGLMFKRVFVKINWFLLYKYYFDKEPIALSGLVKSAGAYYVIGLLAHCTRICFLICTVRGSFPEHVFFYNHLFLLYIY